MQSFQITNCRVRLGWCSAGAGPDSVHRSRSGRPSINHQTISCICVTLRRSRSSGLTATRPGTKPEELEWVKSQEKRNQAIVRSFDALETVPARSRILVIGLDDGVVPWQVADFIRSRFGDDIYWTVVFPPKVEFRRSSRLTALPTRGCSVDGFQLRGDVSSDRRTRRVEAGERHSTSSTVARVVRSCARGNDH
jgi:hypothetical protein